MTVVGRVGEIEISRIYEFRCSASRRSNGPQVRSRGAAAARALALPEPSTMPRRGAQVAAIELGRDRTRLPQLLDRELVLGRLVKPLDEDGRLGQFGPVGHGRLLCLAPVTTKVSGEASLALEGFGEVACEAV